MSQLVPSERGELYSSLGLEHLQEPQVIEEDPFFSERKRQLPPYEDDLFLRFFEATEYKGSPSEGYLSVAKKFIKDLGTMAEHVGAIEAGEREDNLSLPVRMKPYKLGLKPLEDSKLYEGEETAVVKAFKGEVEFLLHSRLLYVDPEGAPKQRALSVGTYSHNSSTTPVYLLETTLSDDKGEYRILQLRSHPPDDISLQAPSFEDTSQPFFTTGQTNEQVTDLYANYLNKIPTASVDESAVVKSWIQRKAA